MIKKLDELIKLNRPLSTTYIAKDVGLESEMFLAKSGEAYFWTLSESRAHPFVDRSKARKDAVDFLNLPTAESRIRVKPISVAKADLKTC
jgi:hypothetical protein